MRDKTWYVVGAMAFLALVPRDNGAPPSRSQQFVFAGAAPEEYAPRGRGGDLDCRDFRSQSEAQAFFEANGTAEDPHRLDGDSDGVACERLR